MKVHLVKDFSVGLKVYLIDPAGSAGTVLYHPQINSEKDNHFLSTFEQTVVPHGEAFPFPSFTINFHEAEEFLLSMAQQCSILLGDAAKYTPGRADVLEGALKATEKHLEDMRRLVFEESK